MTFKDTEDQIIKWKHLKIKMGGCDVCMPIGLMPNAMLLLLLPKNTFSGRGREMANAAVIQNKN